LCVDPSNTRILLCCSSRRTIGRVRSSEARETVLLLHVPSVARRLSTVPGLVCPMYFVFVTA
jgi:hypothetical protein